MDELTTLECTSPRSFLFYVIADVGLQGTSDGRRPLAVAYRQGHGRAAGRSWSDRKERVNEVVDDCASIVAVLTEPANRVTLEAELALAVAWYQGGLQHAELERSEIPDVPQPKFEWSYDQRKPVERPELPWAGGTREFPFISSCLRLALNRQGGTPHHESRRRLGDVQEQPLGTPFHGNKLEYGMVVIDMTDLDSVRYGIVGLHIQYLTERQTDAMGLVEMHRPEKEPEIRLEESRSRRPLSGTAYMRKYHLYDKTDAIRRLAEHSVVDLHSLNYIWPRPTENTSPSRGGGPAPKKSKGKGRRHTTSTASHEPSEDDLLGESVTRIIQDAGTGKAEGEILETHRATMNHPSLQTKLRSRLLSNPSLVHHPTLPSSTRLLLRLAYAGTPHLNWVAFRKLTYDEMAAAMASPELQASARALSICVDERGGDSPATLFNILARSEKIKDVCFLQGPGRSSDDESSRLFSRICESPLASCLLGGSRNIHLTSAFSAPLSRKTWLPQDLRGSESMLAAFPVQHMFVRQQFISPSNVSDNNDLNSPEPARFRPCHFFLGDNLLKPERIVAGFAQYCRSVLTDRFLLSFAAPPSHDRDDTQGLTIGPIPAENLAIPGKCSLSPSTPVSTTTEAGQIGLESETQIECWPLFQALGPNGFVLLVSHEWNETPETRRRRADILDKGYKNIFSIGAPFIRYTFLRAQKRLAWPDNDEGMDADTIVRSDSGYIDIVGGVKDFLRETAPGAEGSLAQQRLDESARLLRERWPETLWEGVDPISVMDESTARAVLRDFLEDAAHVRENLKRAMKARPDDATWYPDLLVESPPPSTASPLPTGDSTRRKRRRTTTEHKSMRTDERELIHPRNGAIFKSLPQTDVRSPNLLGPERAINFWAEDKMAKGELQLQPLPQRPDYPPSSELSDYDL